MKSKLILWIVIAFAVYFLFSHTLAATASVTNDDVIITVTQWCSDPEAVNQIIKDSIRPTNEKLSDYGCHWVPAFWPVEGMIEETIQEYFFFGKLWYMVKIRLIGNFENPIGYTLIRGR